MTWTPPSAPELAAAWIASRRDRSNEAADVLGDYLLADAPREEPELTWQTIVQVVDHYPNSDFFAEQKTEAQVVCGLLAAGPVEDLLSFHGERFIERFEIAALSDPRMAWLLGGTWQFQMNDAIWERVQHAADFSYWKRPST